MATLEEKKCSSILARISESYFTIQTYSVRLCVDLYKGCQFDCAYCFAASYKRNTSAEQTAFGTQIEVRVNGPLKLEQELKALLQSPNASWNLEYICLGATTDSYQPAEQKYELTRESLKVFLRLGLPVTILTKSSLCQRDVDLWSELARRNLGAVGFTVTVPSSVSPFLKQTLEPLSPPSSRVLRTLELFVKEGIRTYVFADPIIPFVTDGESNLSNLVREIANTGNKKAHFGVLKMTPGTWQRLRSRLDSYNPRVIPLLEKLYFQNGVTEFGDSRLPSPDYRRQLYAYIRAECQSVGLGFSCEGGEYDLWLDDWTTVQDPYHHPTGYNLWEIIRRHGGSFVTLPEMLSELRTRFKVLTPGYEEKLSELWRSGCLFPSSSDIGWVERGNITAYYYKGRSVVGSSRSLPCVVRTSST